MLREQEPRYTARELRRIYGLFLATQSYPPVYTGYQNDRTLEPNEISSNYLEELPTLFGKNFVELVESRLRSKNLDLPLKIGDFGCGRGVALRNCKTKWMGQVECTGFTTIPVGLKQYQLDWVRNHLSGVKILQGDIQKIRILGYFDFVISVHTLQYVANPWMIIKLLYNAVAPGGVLMASFTEPNETSMNPGKRNFLLTSKELGIVQEYLEKKYDLKIGQEEEYPFYVQVVCKKTKDNERQRLSLPLRLCVNNNDVQYQLTI